MRVLVIGATGILGRAAVPVLLAAGHDVVGLARDEDRAGAVRRLGVPAVVGDLFDADSLAGVLRGREGVLNLATRIPPASRAALPSAWRANDRVRAAGSAALVAAALRADDVRVIVQEGVTFVYADGGDAELTEDSPIDPRGNLLTSVEAHANVARFAETDGGGRVGVRLRIAALHGDDPLTRALTRGARWGMPVTYGDPDGWTTAIRPADAAAGAVAALGAPSGVYNVGGEPVRKRDLGAVLAGAHRARNLGPGLARLVPTAAGLMRSQRVLSDRLTAATGWRPAVPRPSPEWFAG